ncbi:hypothetical protein [Paraburkholderia sp. J10-1]|uniref:defense against restriction DarA-related protein n=1 Tax=Paraburkholderia sp. J10-1 TaxID=2805430 RepID=UPI002AB64385|nr:hypothetical protein [Paraburkholderia sp. J10-1]
MTTYADIDEAAHRGAFGLNTRPTPSPAQLDAGNYAKGRLSVQGLQIVIENPRGSERSWCDESGRTGVNLSKFHYGYFAGVKGADGDELDCYVGPWPEADRAYVVNQCLDGRFDEHKVMLGFPDARTAQAGYLSNYSPGWTGLGSIVDCSIAQLKLWIANGDLSRPLTREQLPIEETRKHMDKVIWDSANQPVGQTIGQLLYAIRAHDATDGLIFDPVRTEDIEADADSVLVFDALIVPYLKLNQRMEILRKVLDRSGGDLHVLEMQITKPYTQRGTTNVAVVYELSDGQTLSVFFHNPDISPKRIMPDDDLVSWKWMLNKKDITIAVAPERGRDLNVRIVAARVMMLASKNSARFVTANAKRADRMQAITDLKGELSQKQAELEALTKHIDELTVALESQFRSAVLASSDAQSAYIRAQDADGTDPTTGQSADELGAAADVAASRAKVLQAVLNEEPPPEAPESAPEASAVADVGTAAAEAAAEPPIGSDVAPSWSDVADAFGKQQERYIGAFQSTEEAESVKDHPAGTWAFEKMGDSYLAVYSTGVGTYAGGDMMPTPEEAYRSMTVTERYQQIMIPPAAEVDPTSPDESLPVGAEPAPPEPEPNTKPETVFEAAGFINVSANIWVRAVTTDDGKKLQINVKVSDSGYNVVKSVTFPGISGASQSVGTFDTAEAAIAAARSEFDAFSPPLQPEAVAERVVEPTGENEAYLLSIIDGTRELTDPGIPATMKAMYEQRNDEPEFLDLFKQAAAAYKTFALAKARAALEQPA